VDRSGELPKTSPARTVIDLAAILDPETLGECVDIGVRRRLFTVAYLRRRLSAIGRGRDGVRRWPSSCGKRSDRRRPMESTFERRLFAPLREAGLSLPVPQHPVQLPSGHTRYIDLAYPEARLAIEADSYEHHSSRADWARDHTRNSWLVALGWRLLPITWDDLANGTAITLTSAALCPVPST
jgi:very-short-patch-repair endonuclease